MDQNKTFLQNLSELEKSAMAYKRLCLELESLGSPSTSAIAPASPSPPPASPVAAQGLRASASEFVPLASERMPNDLEEQDEYKEMVVPSLIYRRLIAFIYNSRTAGGLSRRCHR